MNRPGFCLCALLFIGLSSDAQDRGFSDSPIDSALLWLEKNYVESPDRFHERALETLAETYRLKDDQLKGEAHMVLMQWHAFHVPFTNDSIHFHGEKALSLFERSGDRARLAATSSELAFEYIEENDMQRSEQLILAAVALYEDLGDEQGLGLAYYHMSRIFLHQQSTDLATRYGLQSLELAERSEDYGTSAIASYGLLLAYLERGDFEKAVQYGTECIATIEAHDVDDDFTLARAYGYRGDAWAELEDYQKSLDDNLKSYAIVEKKIGAARPAAKTYRLGIGKAYYMQGKYKEALPEFEGTIEGYSELGQERQPKMQAIYQDVADCYYQLGDFRRAYINQQLAHSVYDTTMRHRIANLESEAAFKYESGKKDQAIEEQATVILQNSRIQWYGLSLIGLLIVFLSTLYYFYRRNGRTTDALRMKNQENELLLKEIHHRVKNNLQTISSLLSLQSESISDKKALDAVQESKNRVASMALIHQKLYQGENLAAIEMRDYFKTIGQAIKESFGKKAEMISFEVEMSEIELDVDTAIPVGLITNELITNSIKHAFTDTRHGHISITLQQAENGLLHLRIADNGRPAPDGAGTVRQNGFGTLLIQLLTRQLGGTLEKSDRAGTSVVIEFPRQEKSAA